jgi:sialate O-acetylesterase
MKTRMNWAALMVLVAGSTLHAEVTLPAIFGSDMCIARSKQAVVFGRAAAGERVEVMFRNANSVLSSVVIADAVGKWKAYMDTSRVDDEPGVLTVTGANTIKLTNVVVGDVWLCGGQSNMEWVTAVMNNAKAEIAAAKYPSIRLFTVTQRIAKEPTSELEGKWVECSPETVGRFSAVGYYFGRELYRVRQRPMGLVSSNWGGTPADAWLSLDTLKAGGDIFARILERREQQLAVTPAQIEEWKGKLKLWQEANFYKDGGNEGETKGWAKENLDTSDWRPEELPAALQSLGLKHGAYWFRREFTLSAQQAASDEAILHLSRVDDFDVTYINGQKIGETGVKNGYDSGRWGRRYKLTGGVLKPGRNVVTVRLFDAGNEGGLMGPPADLKLAFDSDLPDVPLSGLWLERTEKELPLKDKSVWAGVPTKPQEFYQQSAGALWDGMLVPIQPMTVTGAIWYQGEANAWRAVQYAPLLTALIGDWRKGFSNANPEAGEFPFLIVQLANYITVPREPGNSWWAELRESQAKVARDVPRCGLAVTFDIGEEKDIHPRNKQDVGARLALVARKVYYGEKELVASGPIYKSARVEGGKIVVSFSSVGGGLRVGRDGKGDKLAGFAVWGSHGQEGKWVWADAKVLGRDQIEVSAPEVVSPKYVRYAWADNCPATLYNAEGLPAVPFRTDEFELTTSSKR